MGERRINDYLNVNEIYTKVNIINPYRFKVGTTLKEGLVSCWELDETSGTIAYDSYGTNDGTVIGATINQTGKINKCYSYDGVNDEVEITDNSSLTLASGSLSMWFNPSITYTSGGVNEIGLIGANKAGVNVGDWVVQFQNTGKIVFFVQGGGAENNVYTTQTTWSSGVWYNIVCTWSNTSGKQIYVNSALQGTNSGLIGIGASSYNTYIGSRHDLSKFFNGKIDQTGIWNRVLTSDEIEVLYNSGDGLAYSNW